MVTLHRTAIDLMSESARACQCLLLAFSKFWCMASRGSFSKVPRAIWWAFNARYYGWLTNPFVVEFFVLFKDFHYWMIMNVLTTTIFKGAYYGWNFASKYSSLISNPQMGLQFIERHCMISYDVYVFGCLQIGTWNRPAQALTS